MSTFVFVLSREFFFRREKESNDLKQGNISLKLL